MERGIHPAVEDEISIRSKVASGKELVGALVLIMKGGLLGLASLNLIIWVQSLKSQLIILIIKRTKLLLYQDLCQHLQKIVKKLLRNCLKIANDLFRKR